MSVLEGINQCWPLGRECVVWWDAWAVVIAVTAVAATVFLGVMTLLLGLAANRASSTAVSIAGQEAERNRKVAAEERLLILNWISGEIADQLNIFTRINKWMQAEGVWESLETDHAMRAVLADELRKLEFPTCESMRERLHVIGNPVAGQLARAVSVSALLRRRADIDYVRLSVERRQKLLKSNRRLLLVVEDDLKGLASICTAASGEAGTLVRVHKDGRVEKRQES